MPRLRLAASSLLAAAALTSGLAACGSSTPSASTDAHRETVRIALDYAPNVDYLGIYAAIEKGYFARQGIEPQVIPYANTPAETLVRNGRTDLGISYPPDVIINRAQGLRYKAVGALVAGNATALAVRADSGYTRPAQLSGQLYGGFGIQSDKPLISAILRADGVADPDFQQVVLNSDVITALAKRRIAYTAVFTGIDDVAAEQQGVALRTFPFRDVLGAAGDYPNAVYVASDDAIAKRGPALRRALTALAQGYRYAAAHPAAAERILIAANRTALGNSRQLVAATGDATAKLFLDSDGRWGEMQDEDFRGLGRILQQAGVVRGALPPPADLYTDDLLPDGK